MSQIPVSLGLHATITHQKGLRTTPGSGSGLAEQYPAIAAKAKAEGGEIHWGDETALTNTDVRDRSYASAGQTPMAYAPGRKREKLSMASVTNQRKMRWMIID
jgi:hypothetical protein